MPNDDRIQELVSAYTLGVLDGDDLKELEDYLKNNPGYYRELMKENEDAFSQLSYVVKGSSPAPQLRDKLLNDIKAEKKPTIKESSVPFWQRIQPIWMGLGSAAAVVIIVVLIGYSVSLKNTLNAQQTENLNLENRLMKNETELAALKDELGAQSEALAFLENPDVVIINLVKTEPGLKAVGRVLWNTGDDEALFYGVNLPQVPEGKTYQLWAIAGDVPKSAGVFKVDGRGNNVHLIKSLSEFGDINTFAVSLEPAGGVPLPTGEIYLAGET
jgi:anti-sigma-K factor RskA